MTSEPPCLGVWWQVWAGRGRGLTWVLHLHFGDVVLLCSLYLCWCHLSSSPECEWREHVETTMTKGRPQPWADRAADHAPLGLDCSEGALDHGIALSTVCLCRPRRRLKVEVLFH